jgi:hypothetical protein
VCGWSLLCGGSNGGANSETTVTIKPAQSEEGGSESAGDGGGSSTESGGGAPAEGFGTLVGTVSFDGTPPVLANIVEQGANIKDGQVCAAQTIPDESLLVNGGKIANVCVFLENAPAGAPTASPAEAAIFDQKGCRFLPHVLSVRSGQELRILNGTFPKRNSPFNSIIETNDRTGAKTSYAKPEKTPVEVKCDIHAWMRAFHLVLDHPFAAVSGEDGTFRIEGVPAGDHEFKVWHEKKGYLERKLKVTIKPNEETTVDLKYGAADFASYDGPKPKTVVISALP